MKNQLNRVHSRLIVKRPRDAMPALQLEEEVGRRKGKNGQEADGRVPVMSAEQSRHGLDVASMLCESQRFKSAQPL